MARNYLLAWPCLLGDGASRPRRPTSQGPFPGLWLGPADLQARSSRSARRRRTSASSSCRTWFEGYLTGFNALYADTYDVLPWQPPALLADFTFNVCGQNPDAPMLEVANALIRELLDAQPHQGRGRPYPDRRGRRCRSALYRDTIRAMQQRLVELGFLKGGVDGARSAPAPRQCRARPSRRPPGSPRRGNPDVAYR